jgi:hypothetical protein
VHRASAQQMQVKMMDSLPAVIARIHHHAISLLELLRARKFRRSRHQVAEQRLVLRQRSGLRDNMDLWNDEQVGRCLGIDVGKANAQLVFIDSVGWDVTRDDLAKQAVWTHFIDVGGRNAFFTSESTSDALPQPTGCTLRQTQRGVLQRDD